MGNVGPMFGQLDFFYIFAGKAIEDKRPMERYRNETKRLLGVIDSRLEGREWIMDGDYTVADIALFPWVRTVRVFYEAAEIVGMNEMHNLNGWLDRCLARPASEKDLTIPPRG